MINFFIPINQLGYGVFGYHLMRAFDRHVSGDIALFPVPCAEFENDLTRRWIRNGARFERKDPGIMICPASWLNRFCGQPMIGFPIFEHDFLPEPSLQIVRQLDAVLQASQWGKIRLERQGVRNVRVVPGGYDPDIYVPAMGIQEKLDRIEKQGVAFVHVGKFEARKSSEEILRCFGRACAGVKRPVNLMFHVNNPFDDRWREKVDRVLSDAGFRASGPRYFRDNAQIIVPQQRGGEDLARVYQKAEFGVWASKAEGWNLPLIECIACGLPCITTDNTAQSDFIRAGVYPRELILKSHPAEPTREGRPWWPVDEEELTARIRAIIDAPEAFLNLGERCLESVRPFTWENSARKLGEALRGLGVQIQDSTDWPQKGAQGASDRRRTTVRPD